MEIYIVFTKKDSEDESRIWNTFYPTLDAAQTAIQDHLKKETDVKYVHEYYIERGASLSAFFAYCGILVPTSDRDARILLYAGVMDFTHKYYIKRLNAA